MLVNTEDDSFAWVGDLISLRLWAESSISNEKPPTQNVHSQPSVCEWMPEWKLGWQARSGTGR